ncbi:hypothetical protein RSSM_06699 [Rhodopirellula sallentina SM41]|uniref:Uncharacterized protein n=1 Tax=Rhodopirellula sallentina SM41 TaxID=1263870 RepID=M5TRP8_9BACT|nr:hypothetical protein RSSM_06699 [Rhodopirellula sallentina SM41]
MAGLRLSQWAAFGAACDPGVLRSWRAAFLVLFFLASSRFFFVHCFLSSFLLFCLPTFLPSCPEMI